MAANDRSPLGSSDIPSAPGHLAREALLVGLLALTLNLAGNGRISLWDRDEPRYAGCTREMRESGDLIHPTFNAEPRYHKPVLIYWLMLLGTAVGGDNPFGARLVSAVAGAGTCVMVWAWGRRMLGARAGRLAALILATTPIVIAESKMATTDATLMFFVVGCQFALWELAQRPSRRAAAVFWAFLGLAILTKSPAGPVLIAASAVASWWWRGPTACWKRLHGRWGPLLCTAIAAPWNVAILVRSEGAYYHVAVGYHIIRRMSTGIEQHGGFPGYYVVLGLVTCFPWSVLLPAALVGAWTRRKQSPAFGFLLGWAIGPLVLLECVRTKLIHYYLPSFPAWSLLVAWLVVAVADSGVERRQWPLLRHAFRLQLGAALGMIGAMAVAAYYAPPALRWPCLAVAGVLAAGTVLVVGQLRGGGIERAAAGLMVTAATSALLVAGWLLPAVEPFRISAVVGHRLARLETREHARSVLCSYQLPGVIYALGHPAPTIHDHAQFVAQVGREGKVVTALLPKELANVRADGRLTMVVRETVTGFNLDKGRTDVLHLAVIRPSGLAVHPDRGSSTLR